MSVHPNTFIASKLLTRYLKHIDQTTTLSEEVWSIKYISLEKNTRKYISIIKALRGLCYKLVLSRVANSQE